MVEAGSVGSAVLARLNQDHHHLAMVMGVFERELAKIGTDAHVDWNLMADIVAYVQEYPDAVHHPLEDRLFDQVLDKGLTPAERELVHFNLSQHEDIIAATVKLAADIDNLLNDIVVPVDQLRQHCEDYLEMQKAHMHNENKHLFPLAERLLEDDDWAEIGEELERQQDPLFQLRMGRFDSLYDHVAD